MTISIRKTASIILKILAIISSLGGLILSLISATFDGYISPLSRTMYFTAQSNLWIGLTLLIILLTPSKHTKLKNILYLLKYIFTVSITVTFIVYTFLLAPFGDESYHLFSFSSILTHIFSPAFAIADFFIDEYRYKFNFKYALTAVIPPLCYVLATILLHLLNVNFGRGVNYPYFFFNVRSPAGLFGFSNVYPFFIGSFYWIITLAIITLILSFAYLRIKALSQKIKNPR
ncbi:MAG: Pr6Pr family membrane protein [Clostridia bacterium]|nr:Pr6Pr family membrane protein [Clostridia bacterium]